MVDDIEASDGTSVAALDSTAGSGSSSSYLHGNSTVERVHVIRRTAEVERVAAPVVATADLQTTRAAPAA